MSFTTRTITHTFTTAAGDAAAGSVDFVLPQAMTNGTETRLPGTVTVDLDGAGAISVSLAANDDTGTVPTGVQWQVTVNTGDTQPETYSITVPSAGTGSIDLATLLPGDAQDG